LIQAIKTFLSRAFYLKHRYASPAARGWQLAGILVFFLWGAWVLFQLIEYRNFGLFFLGLVVLAGWIPLWRALFGLAASFKQWR